MATIIQQFCKVWSNVTSAACSCIASVVKKVYKTLEYGDDSGLIGNVKIDSSKDIGKDSKATVVYTFSEVFKKYGINKGSKLNQDTKPKLT